MTLFAIITDLAPVALATTSLALIASAFIVRRRV